jgi:radical SAM/Cys-rich protein
MQHLTTPEFDAKLSASGSASLTRARVTTLQVNVGKRCDLACHHCHVEAGPKRTEMMDARTAQRILFLLERNPEVETLDLTGGAPELNEHFRELVAGARALGREVIDRCNLTVLFQPGQKDTAEFLAVQGVRVVASLPCYSKNNVEAQRGKHVFDKSIEALARNSTNSSGCASTTSSPSPICRSSVLPTRWPVTESTTPT